MQRQEAARGPAPAACRQKSLPAHPHPAGLIRGFRSPAKTEPPAPSADLPAAQRAAFLLHEEAGLTVAEIAAATGTNEEAAKSRLRYAMAKLKAAVDE